MAASPSIAGPVSGPSAETAGPVLTMLGAPLAFHVMAKPTGAVCNLDCEYLLFPFQGDALLRAGQAPAELMAIYAAQDSRRGRNDPCPCGNGRKWKHCHGASLRSAANWTSPA
jgi:hypothetical protein